MTETYEDPERAWAARQAILYAIQGFVPHCSAHGLARCGCLCGEDDPTLDHVQWVQFDTSPAAVAQEVAAFERVKANSPPTYDDDPVWDSLFARSQDMLKAMADKAREDYRAGRTRPLTEADFECPPVSLPTAPDEETRSAWDICPVCNLATLYCRGH